jgi:hypothetical protein
MPKEVDHVADVVEVLVQRHSLFARSTIDRWVREAFSAYGDAPIQGYVPILVQRQIEARLRSLETDEPHSPHSAQTTPNLRSHKSVQRTA